MVGILGVSLDALREITNFLNSASILRLWLSGDSLLQDQFRRGGVGEVRFEDMSLASTSRWPMMLGELQGLTKLSIIREGFTLGPAALVWRELSRLRRLVTLNFFVSDTLLYLEQGCVEGVLELENVFPQLRKLQLGHLTASVLPAWLKLPKQLDSFAMMTHQALEIDKWQPLHDWTKITALKFASFRSLPIADFHPFCPNLTVYFTQIDTFDDAWLLSLPPSVTQLYVHWQRLSIVQTPFSSLLPPLLESMNLVGTEIAGVLELDLVQCTHLRRFDFCVPGLPKDVPLTILPASLLECTLYLSCRGHHEVYIAKGLRKFNFSQMGTSVAAKLFTWDPEGPVCKKTLRPTKFQASTLPDSLVSLKMKFWEHGDRLALWRNVNKLPNLEVFHWLGLIPEMEEGTTAAAETNENADSSGTGLPPLETAKPVLNAFSSTRISDLNIQSSSLLEFGRFSNLRVLSTIMSKDDTRLFDTLPRTLTSLHLMVLEVQKENWPIDSFYSLPNTLTVLKISNFTPIMSLELHHLQAISKMQQLLELELPANLEEDISDSDFSLLPDSLTSLAVYGTLPGLTGNVFKYLPRNLLRLELSKLTNFEEDHFVHLPKGLRTLVPVLKQAKIPSAISPSIAFMPMGLKPPTSATVDPSLFPDPRTPIWGFISQAPRQTPPPHN